MKSVQLPVTIEVDKDPATRLDSSGACIDVVTIELNHNRTLLARKIALRGVKEIGSVRVGDLAGRTCSIDRDDVVDQQAVGRTEIQSGQIDLIDARPEHGSSDPVGTDHINSSILRMP